MPTKKKNDKKSAQKLQYQWGMLCQLSSLDQQRNNISMFDVIDQLHFPKGTFDENGKPNSVPFRHELIISWRRILPVSIDAREIVADVSVDLVDPDDRVLQSIAMPVSLAERSRLARQRIGLSGILVTKPGDYCYRIKLIDHTSESAESAYENVHFEVTVQ